MFEITFNSLEQHKENSNQKEDPVNHENLWDHFWNFLKWINPLCQDSDPQKIVGRASNSIGICLNEKPEWPFLKFS